MKNNILHKTAKSSHYNKEADHYDKFNDDNSKIINKTIASILKAHKIKTVLDMTCGTGSQVFCLAKQRFSVTGLDINQKMLNIAKNKAKKSKIDVDFIKGDMRTSKVGKFDAVLTIFNSIGHLTKSDYIKAIRNIRNNLNDNGLYIFDIFNLNYLTKGDNITKLTIDWQKKSGNTVTREIQYSTIDKDGILASYDIYHEQKGTGKPKISNAFQTLQVYNAKQLIDIFKNNGFKVIKKCCVDGTRFYDFKSERLLVVAKKC